MRKMSKKKPFILHDNYYNSRISQEGLTAYGAGWRDKLAQERRFEQLAKVINNSDGFSINDVGCGLGHLYEYLHALKFKNLTYSGYDISENMISMARKRLAETQDACFTHINTLSEISEADYSVASGIFNYKGNASEADWLSYILSTIDDLNRFSINGFAFNMLTKYSDVERMVSALYYADPCFIFDFCKRNYSKNVSLLHDYQEYDFTMIVRKYQ
jgi:SAM-dependent methyltransferase